MIKAGLAALPADLLLDAGMGTALIARGLDVEQEPSALWNLTHPDDVLAVHREHRAAGAGALHTNTFAGNRLMLAARGQRDVRGCNLAAVRLAREAADGALVIGGLGPSGDVPPPEGEADLFELEEAFAEQASVLAEGGVDLLHIETMYHPKELRAALRGCREGAPELAVVVSISCRRRGDDFRSHLGFCANQLLSVAVEEKADAVGVNCTMAPVEMMPFVRTLIATGLPVFAQPTATPDGAAPLYPKEFGEGIGALFDLGVRAAGGCCGTGAPDLVAAREVLDARARARTLPGH